MSDHGERPAGRTHVHIVDAILFGIPSIKKSSRFTVISIDARGGSEWQVRLSLLLLPRWLDEAGLDDLTGFFDDVADDLAGGLDFVDEAGGLASGEERAGGVEGVADAHVVHYAVLD